jgi:hypothetical protein
MSRALLTVMLATYVNGGEEGKCEVCGLAGKGALSRGLIHVLPVELAAIPASSPALAIEVRLGDVQVVLVLLAPVVVVSTGVLDVPIHSLSGEFIILVSCTNHDPIS